jgi:hypothetical protein
MSSFGRGLSAAGYAAGDLFAKGALMDQQSALETARQERLLELRDTLDAAGEKRKIALADQARTDQTARIDAKAAQLAEPLVAQKRGLIDANITDRSSWTAEQQAAVDQSLGNDRKGLMDEPKLRAKAAVATGDISPKDAATLDQRSEADLTRLMLGEQRNQTMALIASGHDDTRKLVAGMAAAAKKDGANKEDRVLVHQFLGQFDRKISGNQSEIRSLRASLKGNFDEDEKSGILDQIRELESANKNLEKAQMQYAKDSGVKVPTVAEDKPAPAAAPKPWEKYGKPKTK